MPGIYVSETTRPGPSALLVAPSSTYFVVGQTERGDTANPIRITSMSSYQDQCGAKVAYGSLYNDLSMFFAEGGAVAYIARVVGGTPTLGTLTLSDRAGSPLATLVVTAKSAGAWSANLQVEVVNDTLTNNVTINLYYQGTLVERYGAISSPANAVTAMARSSWVTVTNPNSVTVAPNNNPAALTPTALSAGTDDRGTINTASYTAALARFGPSLGAGAVSIPGQSVDNVGTALVAHAAANNRIALCAPALGSNATSVKASAATLRIQSNAQYAGVFYPWVAIPDGLGGTTLVSAEGYVAGVRARALQTVGPWRIPAGPFAISKKIVGVETAVDQAAGDDLDNNCVSVIRLVGGAIQLYGYRSLSPDTTNYFWLRDQDILNFVLIQATSVLQPFIFDTIDGDGRFFGRMAEALRAVLEPMRIAGGLYPYTDVSGNVVDLGYLIDTGPDVNTSTTLGQNIAKANVGIRVSPAAEFIYVTVTKAAVGTSF